jgi:hypothetical protein
MQAPYFVAGKYVLRQACPAGLQQAAGPFPQYQPAFLRHAQHLLHPDSTASATSANALGSKMCTALQIQRPEKRKLRKYFCACLERTKSALRRPVIAMLPDYRQWLAAIRQQYLCN